MNILSIETSCDDTSVAIVNGEYRVLANITNTQTEHDKYGGVVPEVASRLHIKYIMKLTVKALDVAGLTLDEIDAVAVSVNPGLIGSLLVGVSFAKALSYSINKPLIAVNHLLGHIYANRLQHNDLPTHSSQLTLPNSLPTTHYSSPTTHNSQLTAQNSLPTTHNSSPTTHHPPATTHNSSLTPPFLALVVSGGHTELVHFKDELNFSTVGKTTDDAAGEAFDKTAKLMGLGFPGGPIIDNLSKDGNPNFVNFPRAFKQRDNYDFSYSGLKTSVMTYLKDKDERFIKENIHHIAASVQAAIVEPLVNKTTNYAVKKKISTIALAGGVSANSMLRSKIYEKAKLHKINVVMPPIVYCLDNASMIGAAAVAKYNNKQFASLDLNPFSTKGVREV